MMLGGMRPLDGSGETEPYHLPPDDWSTHGVIVGMTGSGKTGLLLVIVEEALRSSIPVVMIDIKGDLPNLLLTFPNLAPSEFAPWVDARAMKRAGQSREELSAGLADKWPSAKPAIENFKIDNEEMGQMVAAVDLDGKKLEDVVDAWIAANEARWKAWIGQ